MEAETFQDHDDLQEGLLTAQTPPQTPESEPSAQSLPPEAAAAAALAKSQKTRRWKDVILDNDEEVQVVIHTSFLAEFVGWLTIICMIIFLSQLILPLRYSIVFGMLICVGMLARWWYTRRWAWAVTNRRAISRLGFLSKTGTSVSYNRVTDIDVKRPFMSWFFGRGQVDVNTAAGTGDNLVIYGQRDPENIEAIIRKFMSRANSSSTETATGNDKNNSPTHTTQERLITHTTHEKIIKHTHASGEPDPYQSGIRNIGVSAGTPFAGIEGAASSLNAAENARRETATWFLEQVWTPNDPETYVQLRRVHYRYLTQDSPQRADGQPYTNSLRNWRYLQRAALEASRLGWFGMLLPNTESSAHYYPMGDAKHDLTIWAAHSDLDDILLPLCQRLELPYLSYASALVTNNLARFAHKTCKPHTAVIYLSDYDPWLEPVVTKQLEKQLSKVNVDLRVVNLALSAEQVEQHMLAPVPSYDPIHLSQAREHRVELAALEGVRPGELARLVENAATGYRQLATSESVSAS
ncbi:MAG: PH domain-containing protein [Deinococcota bacterium]